MFGVLAGLPLVNVPDGEGDEKQQGNAELKKGDDLVAAVPGGVGQGPAHDEGADDGAYAPEAVEPAHVPGSIVKGYIVVQRRVDGPAPRP